MDYLLTFDIIQAALREGQSAYAQQTAERWLQEQPGHLTMSIQLAEVFLAGRELREVERIVRAVLEVDPESGRALALAARLERSLPAGQEFPWKESATLIPALAELERCWRANETERTREMAEGLLTDHPRLAKAHLILADSCMALGDESAAVAHIHQAASLDPGGEIAGRIWDGQRPYQGAWPSANIPGAGPLPHAVAAALGLNLLNEPAAKGPAPKNGTADRPSTFAQPAPPAVSLIEETLISIQTEINRLSGRPETSPKPELTKSKWVRLKPVYAIIASKERLLAKYGQDGLEQIDGGLQALAAAAEARLQLPAGVLYLDDATSLSSFQLDPVDPADPWAVKSLLNQLDGRLEEHEQELGWVLLVGGPDLIAFHRLPNPTDDGDPEVLSDNPYGCRDDNYFVPQRAVGRLPDGDGNDPTLLLQNISTALAAHHADRRVQRKRLRQWWEKLLWLLQGRRFVSTASFGYSASVWRKASLTVFSKIGPARHLRMSPPLTAAEFSGLALGPARYAYFNLHGIADGPNWYGQRDPSFPADYPAFPVALRPGDVGVMGSAPELLFTEACYGAYLEGKGVESALSLKFLAAGVKGFVGSTCIAYGGLNSTPEAADLLAFYFWQEIMAGRSGGVAFQQAKVSFAEHLDQRQGYLDGEDQKTLISFVYYGDPTLTMPPAQHMIKALKKAKTWKELTACPPTICAKWQDRSTLEAVSPKLVDEVRARVVNYLPGMEDASLSVARQRTCLGETCSNQCWNCRPGAKSVSAAVADKMVFTLFKSAVVAGKTHEQVVKVTVDDAGQMFKLTVSK